VSGTHPLPLVPPPESARNSSARGKRFARRRRWPAWAMLLVSLAGIIIAIVALNNPIAQSRMTLAIVGYALVIVGGTSMLFVQRVLDVGVARMSGTPLISSFDIGDRLAFGVLLIASVANGIVIALEVARQ
jgi:DMSO/TMAO reductase YedYZ heme-binding membrane subunit